MPPTCGNDPQKLALLQATEPDLVATLLEIDRSKKALRGHSSACCASNCRLLAPSGSEWTLSQSPGYQSAALALLITPMCLAATQSPGSTVPRRTSSAATRTMRREESPPNLQRTKSAATPRAPKPLKALNKSSVQTLLPLKQREQQSEMQIFLDRRAALWPACSRPAANAKSSKSPLCDCMPKSSHRRHHVCVADIEVSGSDSLGLSEEEIIVPPSQTWKQSLCHFFGGAGR